MIHGRDIGRARGLDLDGADHLLAQHLTAALVRFGSAALGVIDLPPIQQATPSKAELQAVAVIAWAREVDSWDLGDLLADTFGATRHVDRLIDEWSRARHGFTKRLAFAMIARQAVSAKDRPDADFVAWFPLIHAGAEDERNEVRKAVSWALRQIGWWNLLNEVGRIAKQDPDPRAKRYALTVLRSIAEMAAARKQQTRAAG